MTRTGYIFWGKLGVFRGHPGGGRGAGIKSLRGGGSGFRSSELFPLKWGCENSNVNSSARWEKYRLCVGSLFLGSSWRILTPPLKGEELRASKPRTPSAQGFNSRAARCAPGWPLKTSEGGKFQVGPKFFLSCSGQNS